MRNTLLTTLLSICSRTDSVVNVLMLYTINTGGSALFCVRDRSEYYSLSRSAHCVCRNRRSSLFPLTSPFFRIDAAFGMILVSLSMSSVSGLSTDIRLQFIVMPDNFVFIAFYLQLSKRACYCLSAYPDRRS